MICVPACRVSKSDFNKRERDNSSPYQGDSFLPGESFRQVPRLQRRAQISPSVKDNPTKAKPNINAKSAFNEYTKFTIWLILESPVSHFVLSVGLHPRRFAGASDVDFFCATYVFRRCVSHPNSPARKAIFEILRKRWSYRATGTLVRKFRPPRLRCRLSLEKEPNS